MRITPKNIVISLTVIFTLSFLGELYLESKKLVDSIGLGYTLYVALVCTMIISTVILIVYFLIRSFVANKPTK